MANGEFHSKGGIGSIVVEVMGTGAHGSLQPTHRLNVIGFFCPVPVAEAKKAFTSMVKGEVLELLADDPEVLHDLPMLIDRSGHRLISIEESMGEYCFLVEVTS
jgi:tRNA 2-thiouridine synthesizing protein A